LGTGGWEFESPHSDQARRFYFGFETKGVKIASKPRMNHYLGVAQSGRAPARGAGDWEFESPHPDQARRFYFEFFFWV
jgi:hypothetical protein